MITLDQACALASRAHPLSAGEPARIGGTLAVPRPSRIARYVLEVCLFISVLISFLVFIEPSPYEFAVMVLAFACLLARVTLQRQLLPMIWLLLLWNFGGIVAYFKVSGNELADRFVVITLFMAISAIVFAAIFSNDSLRRLNIMRTAYAIAGFVAAIAGIVGYFKLFPGAGPLLAPTGRASGTFKDPNVYGPFLILPILFLLQSLLLRGVRLISAAVLLVILLGFFLSFSRGAWIHFLLSAVVMLGLMIMTAETYRARARLILLGAVCALLLGAGVVFAITFSEIATMFKERAQVVQYYDVGSGGRFTLQALALTEILNFPLGMGPYAFHAKYGLQQHNVYLQAFLVYGWVGGLAYIALVLLTLFYGFFALLKPTPWQLPLIALYATFVGAVAEGIVIDTDHWRHFFMILGIIWGLVVATKKFETTQVRT